MIHWGINALNHGSSLAVFDRWRHIETVASDKIKIDQSVIHQQIADRGMPDRIFWYERPWLKKARQVYAGQYDTALRLDNLPSHYLKEIGLGHVPVTYTPHHASHAAAGYYTSPFNNAAVVVLDAIGEFECASIWHCVHGEMRKVWSKSYPHSLGLFYSAFTKLLGMTPIRDEYILQQMAAQGDPDRYRTTIDSYFGGGLLNLDYNFHRGVTNWELPFKNLQDQCDLAASIQEKFTRQVTNVVYEANRLTGSDCLVYMGGCAMNSDANKVAIPYSRFKYVWSLPNPGDASSAMGAALYHTKQRVWKEWGPVKHLEIKV
jgi:carbamoyltransferase